MIKIKIFGQIDTITSNLVESAISSITDKNETILIVINSVGGSLQDAIAICNMLEAVSNKKITLALGCCASAAAMIFACGDKRYVGKDITYMIHQPLTKTSGQYENSSDIERTNIELKKSLALYKRYIVKGTEIPKEKLEIAFKDGEDLYLNHNECKKYKIATDILTTYDKFYSNENISQDEQILQFNALTQEAEE